MTRVRDAALGIWEFVAGDDWVTALGVVLALALTALISGDDGAWFVMPAAVAVLLTVSIRREARKRTQEGDRGG
jgi:membrane protein implicated in regulation of membrane protease activity